MALMERVAKLLRANLNDLINRAEEPEKMVKQVILDMENQLLQVKTQVAISIADLHLLERKRDENQKKCDEWMRKAQLALSKKQEDLARAAIERSLESGKLARSFDDQIADQQVQVENLKSALQKLDGKLQEVRATSEILAARQRRGRTAKVASQAQVGAANGAAAPAWDHVIQKTFEGEVVGGAALRFSGEVLSGQSVEDQFRALERQEEVERLLAELKSRQSA